MGRYSARVKQIGNLLVCCPTLDRPRRCGTDPPPPTHLRPCATATSLSSLVDSSSNKPTPTKSPIMKISHSCETKHNCCHLYSDYIVTPQLFIPWSTIFGIYTSCVRDIRGIIYDVVFGLTIQLGIFLIRVYHS